MSQLDKQRRLAVEKMQELGFVWEDHTSSWVMAPRTEELVKIDKYKMNIVETALMLTTLERLIVGALNSPKPMSYLQVAGEVKYNFTRELQSWGWLQ